MFSPWHPPRNDRLDPCFCLLFSVNANWHLFERRHGLLLTVYLVCTSGASRERVAGVPKRDDSFLFISCDQHCQRVYIVKTEQ